MEGEGGPGAAGEGGGDPSGEGRGAGRRPGQRWPRPHMARGRSRNRRCPFFPAPRSYWLIKDGGSVAIGRQRGGRARAG